MFFKSTEFCFLLAIIAVTALLHSCEFSLPPLWADETSPFVMAISLVSDHSSDLYHYSLLWGAHLGQFPIAWQHYNGNAIASYIAAPFLYFLGISVAAVRAYELVVAVAVLVLTYYLGKEMFSKKAGMMGASLLAILPSFVFYSRQSPLYDWTDLCLAMIVIIFGVRYLRKKKTSYLAASAILLGVGVYEYLWFAWIVIGLLCTIPLWIKKIKFDKKFALAISASVIAGFSHVLVGYALSPTQSLMPFIISTLAGNNAQYPHASNANFLGNAAMRSGDLFAFLSKPGVAFSFYNSNLPYDAVNYAFSILFGITTVALLVCISKRSQDSRRIGSLLVLIAGIFVSSMFTISEFLPIQISIMLPFLFISIGRGLESILLPLQKWKINYLAVIVIFLLGSTQVPTLLYGFDYMANSNTSQTAKAYDKMGSYLSQNNLKAVSLDFFTAKVIPFYSDGKIVPVVMRWTLPQDNDVNKFREQMPEIQDLDLKSNYLFLAYSYPNFPNCIQPLPDQKPVCEDLDYLKAYASKNNLKVSKTSFLLPDGTSFVTGFELR